MSPTIHATRRCEPPAWARLQRRLLATMSEAAREASARYSFPDGTATFVEDVDDAYEARAGRGALYALGGDDDLRPIARREWEATTRLFDDAGPGCDHPKYVAQLTGEYYNLAVPFEWFHQGEGNQSFYELALAEPDSAALRERAARFADLTIDERNYDAAHRVFRSPFPSSAGPLTRARDRGEAAGVHFARAHLTSRYRSDPGSPALRASLHPFVRDLEEDWPDDPERRREILDLFDRVVLGGDVPTNLTAAGLVTHAFLFTGEDRYRRWVLDYAQAWIERIDANGGLVPDNVGPTGRVGEQRRGQWWGGLYGWSSRWAGDMNFGGLTVAAECALLLSGDAGYLELLRRPLLALLERARTTAEGRLEIPKRMGPEGWTEWAPPRLLQFAHLYHASMSAADRALIVRLREGDPGGDWNHVESLSDRRSQQAEHARFQYYDGPNPDWPEAILGADLAWCESHLERIQAEDRDPETLLQENRWPPNPVVTKGLTQVTTGAPQTVYNGGLLRSTVRHFDLDLRRPGLPPEVACLVEGLSAESVDLRLVNTGRDRRRVLVQAGAFGEHEFTQVEAGGESRQVGGRHLAVELAPEAGILLRAGLRRFVRTPSYGAALDLLKAGPATPRSG